MFVNTSAACKLAQDIAAKEMKKKKASVRSSEQSTFSADGSSTKQKSLVKKWKPPTDIRTSLRREEMNSSAADSSGTATPTATVISPEEQILQAIHRSVVTQEVHLIECDQRLTEILQQAQARLNSHNKTGAIMSMKKLKRLQYERNKTFQALEYLRQQEADIQSHIVIITAEEAQQQQEEEEEAKRNIKEEDGNNKNAREDDSASSISLDYAVLAETADKVAQILNAPQETTSVPNDDDLLAELTLRTSN